MIRENIGYQYVESTLCFLPSCFNLKSSVINLRLKCNHYNLIDVLKVLFFDTQSKDVTVFIK